GIGFSAVAVEFLGGKLPKALSGRIEFGRSLKAPASMLSAVMDPAAMELEVTAPAAIFSASTEPAFNFSAVTCSVPIWRVRMLSAAIDPAVTESAASF